MGDETPQPHAALPATTTAEQNRATVGQRRVNLMWESTQAFVTVSVVAALIYAQLRGITANTLENLALMIAATYYARSNHTKVGGVTDKDAR